MRAVPLENPPPDEGGFTSGLSANSIPRTSNTAAANRKNGLAGKNKPDIYLLQNDLRA